MSFKDRGWSSRFDGMGDLAEAKFEEVAKSVLKRGFVRFGLNRPPLKMTALPARLRYTPDYLMTSRLVEVQGFGRDQTLKLKLDKWGALHWWNDVHPVELFVFDSHNDRWGFVTLAELDHLLANGEASLESFPEGKTYFAFPADALFGTDADASAA
jgi:hypothetical protein